MLALRSSSSIAAMLSNQPAAATPPPSLAQALSVDLSLRHSAEDSSICRCGTSVPLGVRLGLRSRSRPVLEGRWTCGPRCLKRQVAAMVQREMQSSPVRRPYRHRVPLGLLLLSIGAVTHEDLRRALALQHDTGERIGCVLQRECGLSERTVADALAMQWGCGLSTEISLAEDTAACIAPRHVLEGTGMLPVRMTRDGRIHVAFTDGPDALAVFALQRIHRVPVSAGIAPMGLWKDGVMRLREAESVAMEEVDCADAVAAEREIVRILMREQPVESRFVRLHGMLWLRLWLEPAALAGGPSRKTDVADILLRVASPDAASMQA